ncbi:Uncharacterised protein [Escherichia coli]|nr:Uncharacterised protein [Escherichia coli]
MRKMRRATETLALHIAEVNVKLIYNRNNLHIKQLDAFCRF